MVKVSEAFEWYKRDRMPDMAYPQRPDQAWRSLGPVFGHLSADAITPDVVKKYEAARKRKGSAVGTIRRDLVVLSAVLNHAYSLKKLTHKPHVPLPQGGKRREQWLTPDQVTHMIATAKMESTMNKKAPTWLHPFVVLAAYTGQRRTAILNLTWEQVDFQNGTINFEESSDPLRHRRKGRGFVPMAPELEACLLNILPLGKPRTGRIFSSDMFPTSFDYHWKKFITKAGLPAGTTPHVIRHSTATNLVQSGTSIIETAKILGHKNSAITEKTYVKFTPKFLRPAIESLSRLFGGSNGQEQVEAHT